MSALDKNVNCQDIAPLLIFYVCEEVSDKERKQVEAHLASCKACSAQLAEERELQEIVAGGLQTADEFDSSGILLSQCRSELAEALDDLSAPPVQERWRPFGWLRRWMALRPAWSGALLVLLGILLGTQAIPLLQTRSNDGANGPAMNVMARPQITEDQLAKMAVAGINFSPASGSAPGTVQLQLSAEQPLVLSGNVEDTDMRRALTYIVESGERFDAGVRLDCLEALMAAARKDQNPAVRMKALESLRVASADDDVRQALLDALEHDANPGVRVEAVNVLVGSLQPEQSDEVIPDGASGPPSAQLGSPNDDAASLDRVVRVLQQLQRRDPSRYVRLRSAAALRQIGPREVQ